MRIRLVSWNVNGIRASIKKGLWEKFQKFQTEVLAVQETKSDESKMEEVITKHPEYKILYHSARNRKGYSGVATILKASNSEEGLFTGLEENLVSKTSNSKLTLLDTTVGLGDEEFDIEGRIVFNKFQVNVPDKTKTETFVLVNAYYPQGGRGPHRIDYKIRFYSKVFKKVQELKANGEKIVLCGDFNTTVTDIDLARPKQNRNTTGCLPEERDALKQFFAAGYLDTFRHFYPDIEQKYTYWDQITRARDRNVGWRIDYFIVDKDLQDNLRDAFIWDNVMGSDHCPVGIDLEF